MAEITLDRATLTAALALPTPPHRAIDRAVIPEAKPAAIILPIDLADGSLLVVERAAHLRDHAGELCFPGGKPEPADRDLAATALRELGEELGVVATGIELFDGLAPCPVITGKYLLQPFVGVLHASARPRLASGELIGIRRVPLARLIDGSIRVDAVRGEWRGRELVSVFFAVDDRVLYGASAAIAHDLLERLAATLGRRAPPIHYTTSPPWGDRYTR